MATVLIVDDDLEILQLLKLTLETAGYDAPTAKSGEEFEAKVMRHHPDLIVLDIMLGDEYGPDIYDKLLAKGLSSKVPVIFLSALAEDRPLEEPRPGHKYALLGKPFDISKLVREIQVLLGEGPKPAPKKPAH